MPMLALRALAALLSYPAPPVRAALPEIAEVLAACDGIPAADRAALRSLIDDLGAMDPLDAEAGYVEVFDRGRATSLNLFEHLHGETRDRGQAMVDLRALYARGGFNLDTAELPDCLPVLLEYLSCREQPEVRDMIGDCAHILRDIGEALIRRDSSYAAALQAVLRIGGAAPLDPARARKRPAEPTDLDTEWAERPAFEGEPSPSPALPVIPGRTP